MQHVLVANMKPLGQGCKNAVAHSGRATKNVELLRATNIHTKFCTPGLVTRFL